MKDKNSEVVINPLHVMADRRLVPRVQQYLHEHSSQQAISIPQMATDLQKTYTEYSRKKQKAFRTAVFNAYSIISRTSKRKTESSDQASELESKHLEKRRKMESSGKDSDCVVKELSNESSFSSDNEEYVTYKSNNSMNSFLANMYQKSPNVSKLNTNSGSTSAISNTSRNNQTEIEASSSFTVDRKGDTSVIVENCGRNKRNNKEELVTDFVIIDDNSVASEPKTNQMVNVERSNVVIEQVEPLESKETSEKAVKTIARTGQSSKQKKQKFSVESEKKKISVQKSSVTFKDVGGMSEKLIEVCDLVMHLKNPEIFETLGVSPPKGFLLHGPPGCGETLLAHAIAGQFDLPFLKLSATEIVSGVSGESEEKIREVFSEAIASAPCVLFFDEIDAITSKRESTSKGMEQRIVSQLFSCMDDLNRTSSAHVLLIGATNRLDSLNPALRRAGRFDTEISLGIPGEPARKSILQVLCRNLRLSEDFDYDYLARNTPGFVGADLSALASKAALSAVKRIFMELHKKKVTDNEQCLPHDDDKCIADDLTPGSLELKRSLDQTDVHQISTSLSNPVHSALDEALQWASRKLELSEAELSSLSVSLDDFQASLKSIQPSAKREGFATIPDVTWDDIGALKYVREELQILILAPVRHPELCSQLDLNKTSGILLVGPPGCGKTLLAKAVANESGINFISVKGPELLNMYVGESERAVRQVFERARNSAPCVIFFDELDALCPRRSDHGESGASNRVVNQLLTEMDGVEERKQVFLMAASNRPDVIDPAILRPGRLDKTLYVGLPSANEREDILKTITRSGTKPRLSADVSFQSLASDNRCEGLTGADLSALVREASVITLREYLMTPDKRESMNSEVCWKHFDAALDKIKPSVKPEDRVKYEKMRDKLCS